MTHMQRPELGLQPKCDGLQLQRADPQNLDSKCQLESDADGRQPADYSPAHGRAGYGYDVGPSHGPNCCRAYLSIGKICSMQPCHTSPLQVPPPVLLDLFCVSPFVLVAVPNAFVEGIWTSLLGIVHQHTTSRMGNLWPIASKADSTTHSRDSNPIKSKAQ